MFIPDNTFNEMSESTACQSTCLDFEDGHTVGVRLKPCSTVRGIGSSHTIRSHRIGERQLVEAQVHSLPHAIIDGIICQHLSQTKKCLRLKITFENKRPVLPDITAVKNQTTLSIASLFALQIGIVLNLPV